MSTLWKRIQAHFCIKPRANTPRDYRSAELPPMNSELELEVEPTSPSMKNVLEALEAVQLSDSSGLDLLASTSATQPRASKWTASEHRKFVRAVKLYPSGPYERIADFIGTKSIADVIDYGTKCREGVQDKEDAPPSALSTNVVAPKQRRIRTWTRKLVQSLRLDATSRRDRRGIGRAPEVPNTSGASLQGGTLRIAPPRQANDEGPAVSATQWASLRELSQWELPRENDPDFVRKENEKDMARLKDLFGPPMQHSYLQRRPAESQTVGVARTPENVSSIRNFIHPIAQQTSGVGTRRPTNSDENHAVGGRPIDRLVAQPHRPTFAERAAFQQAQGTPTSASRSILSGKTSDGNEGPPVMRQKRRGPWSTDEVARYHQALELYPNGPWKSVADYIGTRTESQVMRRARLRTEKVDDNKEKQSTTPSGGPWTALEHERYLDGLELYPSGPWKRIAKHVGTRTERQVMSHAQSIRSKRKRDEERNQQTSSASDALSRKKYVRVDTSIGLASNTSDEFRSSSFAEVTPSAIASKDYTPEQPNLDSFQVREAGTAERESSSIVNDSTVDVSTSKLCGSIEPTNYVEFETKGAVATIGGADDDLEITSLLESKPCSLLQLCNTDNSPLIDLLVQDYEDDEDVLALLNSPLTL